MKQSDLLTGSSFRLALYLTSLLLAGCGGDNMATPGIDPSQSDYPPVSGLYSLKSSDCQMAASPLIIRQSNALLGFQGGFDYGVSEWTGYVLSDEEVHFKIWGTIDTLTCQASFTGTDLNGDCTSESGTACHFSFTRTGDVPINDQDDPCPDMKHGQGSGKDFDLNGIPDECTDRDKDGIADGIDNCPGIANPDQGDSNRNGVGDACAELDNDRDGVLSDVDPCPYDCRITALAAGEVCFLLRGKEDVDGNKVADDEMALVAVCGADSLRQNSLSLEDKPLLSPPSVMSPSIDIMVSNAEDIVYAEVVKVSSHLEEIRDPEMRALLRGRTEVITSDISLKILKTYKGEERPLTLRGPGGCVLNECFSVSLYPGFRAGERAVFLLNRFGGTVPYSVMGEDGIFKVNEDEIVERLNKPLEVFEKKLMQVGRSPTLQRGQDADGGTSDNKWVWGDKNR